VKTYIARTKFSHRKYHPRASYETTVQMKYRIREHRKRHGWTLDHLAELSGLSKGYLSLLEGGKRDPSAESLRSLAAAFSVDVTEMIEPENDEARQAIDHLAVFLKLNPEDRKAIARMAAGLKPDDAA
jgi:transcriptional regulator with XRE-family HTH domain